MENPAFTTVSADTALHASADRAVRVEEFTQLRPRAQDDPQRLHGKVMNCNSFATVGLNQVSRRSRGCSPP